MGTEEEKDFKKFNGTSQRQTSVAQFLIFKNLGGAGFEGLF